MKPLCPFILSTLLTGLCSPLMGQEPVAITLKTLTAQMKFDQGELLVAPGAKVTLTFENPDDMPHNVVFCQPGTNVEELVMKMLEKPEEAMKRNFLPDDPRVWLKSNLLNPQERQVLEFTAPEKPGLYPYVCSFPGHAMSMKGVLKVLGQGPTLTGLKFSLYLGSWTKLPDFSQLTPHREGPVSDNLIQLNFDDYKNQYGLVFNGTLKAPGTEEYTFYTAADDGVRLIIDGEVVINDDGIHSAKIKEKKKKLKGGDHAVRVEYFQAAGGADLYVGWKSDRFDTTALSKWTPASWKTPVTQKKDEFIGMPLNPKDAPILYRNFIAGAGNRPIGVGFPGGLNFAWSAETMNLALAWQGAFMDTARHWKNRGGGAQPPAGFDVLNPTNLVPPLAVLDSADAAWPVFTPDETPEGYTWKGYTLDAKGVPAFHFNWRGVEVEDRIEAIGDFKSANGKLLRTLKLNGALPQKAFFVVARDASFQAVNGGFLVKGGKLSLPSGNFENQFAVQVEGASVNGDKLLVPAQKEIRISYSWPNIHAAHSAQSTK
ncbi:MAG: PA14 domain-containing protein [Verrucomicrobiota bacterium]